MRSTAFGLLVLLVWTPGATPVAADNLCGIEFGSYDILEAKISGKAGVKRLPSDESTRSYDDASTMTIWNFSVSGSPAHPSAACRKLVQQDGRIYVQTTISCRASKESCDRLAAAYNDLDRQMTESLQQK